MREKARGRLSLVLALVLVAVTGGVALAKQAVVVEGKTIVFPGHDQQRHEIVVGKMDS